MYISKAKAQLILDQPFFASILLSLPMIEDLSIPTLATNGNEVRYNPEFMKSLSLGETVFALAHETLHCVFQHMHRRNGRNANQWNIAADYIINDLLIKDKIGKTIQGALVDSSLVAKGKTTEGVFDLLPAETENKKQGDKDNGGSLDQVSDASNDPAENAVQASEMKVKVIQAINAAKMCGKFSGNLQRVLGPLTKTRVDWRAVLRNFLSERAKLSPSYSKPKRRFLADDIYLPSLTGEKLGSVVIAIDCSGSIDEKLLSKFSTEIKAICSDATPSQIDILYFDTEVLKHETFIDGEEIKMNPIGGGGTAFSPVFKYIDEKGLAPIACVFLTDLCCSDFGDAPPYPVLWASTEESGSAPFGDVISIAS